MDTSIKINKDEQYIFNLLQKVSNHFSLNSVIRVAGGWTRDKLLGKEADDIDIMVDNMSGEKFASFVSKFLGSSQPHVVKTNPEKSKNIETAILSIETPSGRKYKIDFAQARQEVYHDDSRNPQVEPASAEKDAERRDLTINSLFYNINERKVEDFTGNGLKDLENKIIRTPIDPVKTFKDDPLRIFRAIRFASKYGYEIDKETLNAISLPEMKDYILNKISKERIGIEIKKMFENQNPHVALRIMKEAGLMDLLLQESLRGTKYDGEMFELDMDQNNPHHELTLWGHTLRVVENVFDAYQDREPEKKSAMILAALCHDLGKLAKWIKKPNKKGHSSYVGHEFESARIAEHILKYLKLDPYIKEVSRLCKYHMQGHALDRSGGSDKALRKYIRRLTEDSIDWIDAFNLSIADAKSKGVEVEDEVINRYDNIRSKLNGALISMQNPESEKQEKRKIILDGNEIINLLNIKPGPVIKDIIDFVKDLQDENPEITKDEARKKVLEKFGSSKKKKVTSQSASIIDIQNSIDKINHQIKNKNFVRAIEYAKKIVVENQNDEKACQILAQTLFISMVHDKSLKNEDIINFIEKRADREFYDGILISYLVGIWSTFSPKLSERQIEMARKAKKLSKSHFEKMISNLPDGKPKSQLNNI